MFVRSLEKKFENKRINKRELDECLLILQLIEAELILRKPIQSNNFTVDVQDSSLITVAIEPKEKESEIEIEVYLQLILKEIQQQVRNNKKEEEYQSLITLVHHYKSRWIDGNIDLQIE